ncbi:MAG: tripartite tricarboxylate transporter substrate binding protein [Betaproteobacteria bacterium]|nr:tripartite tricarboxylate transporter substrate binding protein [Betaproteobacteria bacterium]MBI2223867.1 tripartite tricarboxylate transporter substrate binding protein [Betaproteobacteria bacterium]MBI2291028.1 tripartite tricarboxylate transporter substrate binding protein [Betaproteobacteria bacterium]
MKLVVFVAAAVTLVILGNASWAQSFPVRPIRIVVGFPPGGGVDVLARILGPKMSESLGQPVVVDNRVGAGGTIASDVVARATPDGHTILIVSASHAVTASMYKKLTYDPVKDFKAISLVASSPNVLLSNVDFPAQSVNELIKMARANPGSINYASGGIGTTGHLSAELLSLLAGMQLIHVPYKGNPLALVDLMAGRVQLMFTTVPTALPQIKAGRVRAIAVTSAKRFVTLSDTPTVAEAVQGYESANWFGVLAPNGTPLAIVSKLHAEMAKALANKEVADSIWRQGAEPLSSTPGEFEAYLKSEIAKWTRTVDRAGIRME